MTDRPTGDAEHVFAATGRPVVRFVALLCAAAAILVALWWTGVFAARVTISVRDGFDRRTNTGVAVVAVRNEGRLPVRVGPPRLAARGDRRYFEPPVRVTRRSPVAAVRTTAGDAARFTVGYAVDCRDVDRRRRSQRGAVSPELRLRGALGTARSTTREVALAGACGEPSGDRG
ncbi:MAG: hypothetical protein QOJ63_2720 [Solirubrobacteraceae bacterium]|jgi:hypothetical protein|nr:hypothetical protein [Solirubrobacteraceae bacterium]